jgi:feruloyl esterase
MMIRGAAWGAGLMALAAASLATAAEPTPEQCRALTAADFGTLQDAPTRITAAGALPAKDGVPALCKVEGYVAPQVGFELRLPLSGWNGKVLTQGCGAMCGTMLGAAGCEEAAARGYACVTTDMGHKGLPYDGKWAYNNPAAEIDFGHRATHVATVAAKAITERFYARAPQYAYFRGCSTGGRQALVAAQRYPYDFDGIIAGAPVLYQLMGPPLQLFWGTAVNFDKDGKPIFDARKLPLLAAAVTQACDGLDGVTDNVISRPLQCKFDPARLQCRGADGPDCLTAAEVEVVRKTYAGPTTSAGERLMPSGQVPGSEAAWGAYLDGGKAASNYGFGSEVLRYLSFDIDPGPDFEVTDFDWDKDPQRMSLSTLTAANPDLTLFKQAGGKLIAFHGMQDPAIFFTTTTEYFDLATRAMGGRQEMDTFARLFLMPGMYHCRGGAGVNHADMLGALEAWVERGTAPDAIMGYHIDTEAKGPAEPPVSFDPAAAKFARPLFPYPDTAAYDGSGDWRKAGNYRRAKGP